MTYRLPSPGRALVGVDVGGTKIAVLVVAPDGQAVGRAVAPSSRAGGDALVAVIESTVLSALEMAQLPLGEVAMLGVGIPGLVDPASGRVETAVNLNLSSFPLGRQLEDCLGRPVIIENDVRAAAFGLHVRGITTPSADLAYLAVGTGIAAGLVLDGRLYRGARGLAGEIGHARSRSTRGASAATAVSEAAWKPRRPGWQSAAAQLPDYVTDAERGPAGTPRVLNLGQGGLRCGCPGRSAGTGDRGRCRACLGVGGALASDDLRRGAGLHRRRRVARRRGLRAAAPVCLRGPAIGVDDRPGIGPLRCHRDPAD